MSTLIFLISILFSIWFQPASIVIAIIYSDGCNILFIFIEVGNF